MKINLVKGNYITKDSVCDGDGLRTVLWLQGCSHKCVGCHNPQTWDKNEGQQIEIDVVLKELEPLLTYTNLTISGGEPLDQPKELLNLLQGLREKDNSDNKIWIYTGYYLDDIKDKQYIQEILNFVDKVVEGPFIQDLKTYDCKFRGSSNQKITKIKKGCI